MGQVPRSSGLVHSGPTDTGPWRSQQISPASQQAPPQHRLASVHVVVQGRFSHLPEPLHHSSAPHLVPQPPQLRGSLAKLVHCPLQHSRDVPQAGLHPVLPALPALPPALPALPPLPPVVEASAPPLPPPALPPAPSSELPPQPKAKSAANRAKCFGVIMWVSRLDYVGGLRSCWRAHFSTLANQQTEDQ